jgi:outer membrane protein
MRLHKLILASCALACAGFIAAAADLGLDEARAMALSNSKTLASLNVAVDSSALAEKSQKYKGLPSASLSASASASAGGDVTLADSSSASVGASVSQTLFDGGKNSILVSISGLSTASARESARAEYYSVLGSVDSAWYALEEAYASRDASKESAASASLALEIATARLESGAISMTDYLKAEADDAASVASLSQAKKNVSVYSMKLASLLGLDALPAIEAVDFAEYESLIAKLASYTDEDAERLASAFKDAAIANSPSLAKAKLDVEKSALSAKSAQAAYLPTVQASVSGGVDYTANQGLGTPSARVSLSASLPLDVWNTKASVDSAKLSSTQASLSSEETQRNLGLNATQACYDLVSQAKTVVSSAKALEYAQRYYENKLEAFKLSSASASDLSSATTLVGNDTNSLIAARYGFLSCLSSLRSLIAADSDSKVTELIP